MFGFGGLVGGERLAVAVAGVLAGAHRTDRLRSCIRRNVGGGVDGHGRGRQDVQGADVRVGDVDAGRRDQRLRAPAQRRAVGRRIGDDVQAAAVGVERHRRHVPGELRRGRGEDGLPPGENAAAGGRATRPRSVIIRPIAAPSPSGARPSHRTACRARRLGLFFGAAPFFACSRAATSAWRARSTPAHFGGHAITAPSAAACAALCSRSCSRRWFSRNCAVRSLAASAALAAAARASAPLGLARNQRRRCSVA